MGAGQCCPTRRTSGRWTGCPPRLTGSGWWPWRTATFTLKTTATNAPRRSTPDDVAAAGCHYLALGHWDRHADVSRAGTTAIYSGCPYGPIGAPEQGAVCVVDLDPDTGVSYRLELLNGKEH